MNLVPFLTCIAFSVSIASEGPADRSACVGRLRQGDDRQRTSQPRERHNLVPATITG